MNMYMDESGSVHPVSKRLNRFFVIGVVMPKNEERLKRVYKVFVRRNFERLRVLDKQNRMFQKNGKFMELKGSCFDRNMKLQFLEFFCQNDLLRVGYIVLDNDKLQKKFISNKARTFNYLLKLFFLNAVKRKYIWDRQLFLQIDERNVRTDSKFYLEDYLNQEMVLNMDLLENVRVQYFDSAQNKLIQIADVFSNILYSNMVTLGGYNQELIRLRREGYILPLFRFPMENKDKNIS